MVLSAAFEACSGHVLCLLVMTRFGVVKCCIGEAFIDSYSLGEDPNMAYVQIPNIVLDTTRALKYIFKSNTKAISPWSAQESKSIITEDLFVLFDTKHRKWTVLF